MSVSPAQSAQQLASYLSSMWGQFSPAQQQFLRGITATIATNPAKSVRLLWQFALQHIRDPAILRATLQMARPALGAMAVGWANIEIACVALTGMTVGAVVVEVMLALAAAVLVVVLVLLLAWLLSKLFEFIVAAVQWTPSWGKNPPMQQPKAPNWDKLFDAMHDPSIGPLYAIENRCAPSSEIMALAPV